MKRFILIAMSVFMLFSMSIYAVDVDTDIECDHYCDDHSHHDATKAIDEFDNYSDVTIMNIWCDLFGHDWDVDNPNFYDIRIMHLWNNTGKCWYLYYKNVPCKRLGCLWSKDIYYLEVPFSCSQHG